MRASSGRVSRMGGVFNPDGIAPCLACGQHSGVEPKIIEVVYENGSSDRVG